MTTPDCRTYAVTSENRTLAIESENRTLAVEGLTEGIDGTGWKDDYILSKQYFAMYYMPANYFPALYCTGAPHERTLSIEADNRTLTIEAENRTLIIEACKDGG
jgi:hypothetical protein